MEDASELLVTSDIGLVNRDDVKCLWLQVVSIAT